MKGSDEEGALFRGVIARWGKAAGAEGRVSGHSLRVGGAQSLAKAGASLVEMQLAGHAGPLRTGTDRETGRRGEAALRAVRSVRDEHGLIETFVETPRCTGAVWRASGWTRVGATQGRGRYDKPGKDVWLRPLRSN